MHGGYVTITLEEHHRLLRAARDAEALREALRVIRGWAAVDLDEERPQHAVALNAARVMALATKAMGGEA